MNDLFNKGYLPRRNKNSNVKSTRSIILTLVFLIFVLDLGFFSVIRAEEKKPLLHFVQISDTHLQYSYVKDAERLLGSSEKLLKDEVEQINKIDDLDFVLATGDLVDVPDEKLIDKFIEITISLRYPLYVLLGNHDVSVNGGLGKKGFIKKFYNLDNPTSFTNKVPYYSFSPNDKFTFICLDGTTDKVVSANGQIEDEKQFSWLKDELEKNRDKFVILAQHFPLIEPFKSESHRFLEPDRTKLLDIINSYKNIIGIFSGHYHAARLQKIKNKIHNSCPATVQYPNAFREVIITQQDSKHLALNFKWHDVDGQELRDKSKNSSKSWALTQGAEEDREQTIKLKLY